MGRAQKICLILCLLNGFLLLGQDSAPLPVDPAVRRGILPNGMHYFLRRNTKPEHRAELWLAVRAGSLQEDEDQAGVAHFVEHMAFNGTRHFPKNELVHYLEKTGVRFGPDLNAYTSFEETVYMLQVRTDSLQQLDSALLILQDWSQELEFDPAETDKERGVVIAEWRNSLSPDQRLQQRYFPMLYAGSRYAERLPIGDPEVIRTIPVDRLRDFYRDWYRPELMAIIAVGDFDLDWMEDHIHRRFGAWAPDGPAKRPETYSVPVLPDLQTGIFTDPELSLTQLRYSIKLPGGPVQDEAAWEQQLVAQLFNGMLNERLLEIQQSKAPPFTFASSGYFSADLGGNHVYFISVTGDEYKIADGFRAVLGATLQAVQHGFQEAALERQKAAILRQAEQAALEAGATNSSLWAGKLLETFLERNSAPAPDQALELTSRLLGGITMEKVLREARRWLHTPSGTLILTAPDKALAQLPDTAALRRLTATLFQTQWPLFEEQLTEGPLLEIKPAPLLPIRRVFYETVGVTELHYPGGLQVVLKPTDFKRDEILFTGFSPGGHALYPDSVYPSAVHTTMVMDQSGAGRFSYPALMKKLTGKTLSLSPFIGELEEGFNGRCAPAEMETLLQLLYLLVTAPRFDSLALASYLQRQEALYRNMMLNPYYVFGEKKEKIKFQNHPRRGIPNAAELGRVRFDHIRNVFLDRFSDFTDFTFVITGAFDPDTLAPLLNAYLGSLPMRGRTDTIKDVGAKMIPGRTDSVLYGGQPPKAIEEITFHGTFDYTAEQRYAFTSLLSVLRIRLRERIREDAGGVYGVNVYGAPSRLPEPSFRLTLSFNCDAGAIDSLTRLADQVIADLKTDGPSAEDIEKVRAAQWQTRLKNEKENSFWLGQLAGRYREGLSPEGITPEAYRKRIDTLDPEMIRAAAIRYFPNDSCIRLRLMPSASATPE